MYSIIIKNGLYLIICTLFIPITARKIMGEIEYKNILTNTLAGILKSCHINDKSSILISGNINPKAIQETLPYKKPIIMSTNFKLPEHEIRHTVELLVISAPTNKYLHHHLNRVHNFTLSDRRQYNIIFSGDTFKGNCLHYSSYLSLAWKKDMLDTIFLCILPTKRIRMFTYNPYANWAPRPWTLSEIRLNKPDIYIFISDYKPGWTKCKNLFFEKTRRLDGYTGVKAVAYVPLKKTRIGLTYDINFNVKKVFDIRIAKLLFKKLNIPFKYRKSTRYGTFNENGIPTGVDLEVANNKYDILLEYRALADTKNTIYASTIIGETGVSFISHYEGHVSTLTQLIHYFKPIIIFFSLVVLALTIAVLKLSINENFDSAVIEVFRLFFNGPLLRVPDRTSPRIFIFTILIYILVMQTILRSKILSFIMAPDSNDLEKFSDLEQHEDYKVYCRRGFGHILPIALQSRCIKIETFAGLYKQKKIALIYDYYFNIGLAKKQKMHHSKEMISKFFMSYRMRRTWPLIRRVNTIFTRIFESGVSGINLQWSEIKVLRTLKHNSNDEKKRRALHLQDLKFAFQFLMYGMISASIIFLIEIRFWIIFTHYFNQIIRRPNNR